MGQNVGYIRVSSMGQNDERQLIDVELEKVFSDKASGASRKRPAFIECMEYLREGDTLHCHSIDRLCRSLLDLQIIVDDLVSKGVIVRFHKENLTFNGDDNPINKLTLQLMGSFAEFERSMIKTRQAEGIAAAKKRGVRLGRPLSLSQDQIKEIKARVNAGESKTELAKEFGVSRPIIYRVIKK